MNRKYRLRHSQDFMRVRRFGKSYAHPLVVLVVLSEPDEILHVGITAGRSVGGAVQRNRAKRLLREAVRLLLPAAKPGWKIILIARNPILNADLSEIVTVLANLFLKADLIDKNHGT